MKRWSDEADALRLDLEASIKDRKIVGALLDIAEARAGTEVMPHHLLGAARAARRSDLQNWADRAAIQSRD